MDACFDATVGFKRVLVVKLRAAAEYGVPYYEYKPLIVKPARIASTEAEGRK